MLFCCLLIFSYSKNSFRNTIRVSHSLDPDQEPDLDPNCLQRSSASDFIWDFGKLPFPSHLGIYIVKIGKISTKIHEIWKIKAIFGLGMTPI